MTPPPWLADFQRYADALTLGLALELDWIIDNRSAYHSPIHKLHSKK